MYNYRRLIQKPLTSQEKSIISSRNERKILEWANQIKPGTVLGFHCKQYSYAPSASEPPIGIKGVAWLFDDNYRFTQYEIIYYDVTVGRDRVTRHDPRTHELLIDKKKKSGVVSKTVNDRAGFGRLYGLIYGYHKDILATGEFFKSLNDWIVFVLNAARKQIKLK